MSLSIISFIYFIALSHALLLIAILFKKSNANQPGRLLAVLLFILSYKLLEGGIYYSNLYLSFPHLLNWLPGAVLIIGPVFYAYVQRMASSPNWSLARWLLNLSPAILMILLFFPNLLSSAAEKIAHIAARRESQEITHLAWQYIALFILIKFHLGSYLLMSWRTLAKVEQASYEQYTNDISLCISWQKKLCLMLMLLELIWIVLFLLQQFAGVTALGTVDEVWLLFVAVIILMAGYWGLQHPDMMIEQFDVPEQLNEAILNKGPTHDLSEELQPNSNVVKYGATSLPSSTAIELASVIKELIENKMLFLQPDLKLADLAELTGVRTHLISQVINQTLNTSFYKLVNNYRVQHAKNLIKQENINFSIEQIGIESGFNKRVTFNKAFKEIESISPSIYRKQFKYAT